MPRNKLSPFEQNARKEISSNFKKIMHGMTQADLAEKSDIPLTTLSGYLREKSTPNSGNLEKLAIALNVKKSDIDPRYTFTDIMDFVEKAPLGEYISPVSNVEYLYNTDTVVKQIPLLGDIACGDPITADENIEDYIPETYTRGNVPSGTLFALKTKGHSMEPTIPDGSIVIIRQQPNVEDGEIAAVLVDDDTRATLKRIKHSNDAVILQPDNREYDPIVLTPNFPGRILGKAIEVKTKL